MCELNKTPKGAENWSPGAEIQKEDIFFDGEQPVAAICGLENAITEVMKVFEENYSRFRNFFGIIPQPFEIKIVESREELDEYLGRKTERWVVAGGRDEKGFAILAPSKFPIESDKPIEHFPKVLTHEVVHVFAHNFDTNKVLPTWFHEGLALCLAEQTEVVSKNLLGDRLKGTSTAEVVGLLEDERKLFKDSRFAYSFACSFIKHLYDHYGKEPFREILHSAQIAQQRSTTQVFEDAFGASLFNMTKRYLEERLVG